VGPSFFDLYPSQLQKLDMLWSLGVHPSGNPTLNPSLLSNKKSVDFLASEAGFIVHCQDEVESIRDTFSESIEWEFG